jgi:hypothetical protein
MKTLDLDKERHNLDEVINLARNEPVILLTSDGREFFVSEADDFEKEVDALRASRIFQKFLDERSACARRIPLEQIEKETEKELLEQNKSVS